MTVSKEFVIDAFVKYLGRSPESEASIAAHRALGSEDAVIKVITESKEYFDKVQASLQFDALATSKFLLIGNCQLTVVAKLINAMSVTSSAVAIELTSKNLTGLQSGKFEISKLVDECDYVIFQHLPSEPFCVKMTEFYPQLASKVRRIPGISYSAFHPDMGYIKKPSGAHLNGPMGEYHSMLVFWAWKNGLSADQTHRLFSPDVFSHLGYFNHVGASEAFLTERGFQTQTPMKSLLSRWSASGCFMHSLNHPKLHVLADISRFLLEREGIEYVGNVEDFVPDDLAEHPCWPIYPSLGEMFGVSGNYQFKQARHLGTKDRPIPVLDLKAFIEASFNNYEQHKVAELSAFRLDADVFKTLPDYLEAKAKRLENASQKPAKQRNPYAGLNDYQFWRRAVESVDSVDVDPVVSSRFQLSREDKVATAGSCFAQHISRTLAKNGFNYYVTEIGAHLEESERTELNYGVFSARYGNIYTSRQLVQLYDRAYGHFVPMDKAWQRKDGRYVDPFRPLVQPSGYATETEVIEEQNRHLACVREMFENMTVFVFTLGLTEAWRRKDDGAVFPLAPGVAAGIMCEQTYEFVNFETHDVVKDIEAFLYRLEKINPNCKIILTVSPVPLIATYENRHVLTSTVYSKSALRAAADHIVRRSPHCEYFPSYEIITGNYSKGNYYETDLRSVREEGVSHVMRLFMEHFSSGSTPKARPEVDKTLISEAAMNNSIVCDEEALDAR